jgi:hypothetical protein
MSPTALAAADQLAPYPSYASPYLALDSSSGSAPRHDIQPAQHPAPFHERVAGWGTAEWGTTEAAALLTFRSLPAATNGIASPAVSETASAQDTAAHKGASEALTPASGAVPHGMPGDRLARMAARRAFVALKLSFLYALEDLVGHSELQAQVRQAEEPEALWALRAPMFAALAGGDTATRKRRQLLNRSLESMFPSPTLPSYR